MKRCVFAALAALMLFSAVEMAARTDRGRQMGPRESRAEQCGHRRGGSPFGAAVPAAVQYQR